MLKLQPANAEVLTELDQLVPPKPVPIPPPLQPSWTDISRSASSAGASASSSQASTYAAPSSSSSSSGSANKNGGPLHIGSSQARPNQNGTKSLPFARTFTDDRKLKISTLPMTIDVPVDLPLPEPAPKGKDKGKRPSMPPLSSIHTQPEIFIYPSWERYVVKRVPE